ncbi:MAG TPA: ParB/RepB/Spo0J family partition protein [Pirellulales bacterium]|nr:ParB/RepB/Spo0J family partition protein [Pirellulales bacterium]
MSANVTHPVVRLPLALIHLDGGTQIRAKIDEPTVAEYAEQMAAGAAFPPPVVFHDGQDYWLADGFHRLAAARLAGLTKIDCEVRLGGQRDARLCAVGANSDHGLRRTNEDKRRAVGLLLADYEWSQKSDRWIAEACGVSDRFVNGMRNQLRTVRSCENGKDGNSSARRSRVGRDGKLRRDLARRPTESAENATAKPSAPAEKPPAPADRVEAALAAAAEFQTQLDRLRECHGVAARLAAGPGGAYLSQEEISHYESGIRTAEQVLTDARPRGRCSHCGGKGCFHCRHKGYTAFNTWEGERR